MIVDEQYTAFFEAAVAHSSSSPSPSSSATLPSLAATYLCNEVFTLRNAHGPRWSLENGGEAMPPPVSSEQLGDVARLVEDGALSKKMGKDLFDVLFLEEERGAGVREVVARRGMAVETDMGKLQSLCAGVVEREEFGKQREQMRAAKGDERKRDKMVKFFFGKVMKESRGMADVSLLREALDRVCEKIK